MVRTKAGSVSTKAIGGKAPQKIQVRLALSGSASKSKQTGGNPYHPRETPGWQKPITFFMKLSDESQNEEVETIKGLPGIPGIETGLETPQVSGMQKNSKKKKPEHQEKKEKNNKNGNADAEDHATEMMKRKKKKNHDDVGLNKEVEKKKEVSEGHSEMEVEDDIPDIENTKNAEKDVISNEESHGDVDMEKENERTDDKDGSDETNDDSTADKAKKHNEQGSDAKSAGVNERVDIQ